MRTLDAGVRDLAERRLAEVAEGTLPATLLAPGPIVRYTRGLLRGVDHMIYGT